MGYKEKKLKRIWKTIKWK